MSSPQPDDFTPTAARLLLGDFRHFHAQDYAVQHANNEIGKSCMTVAVKACAKKKDAKSDMK
jgi:hypothetical protein